MRPLIRSSAFQRDLRKWLKPRPLGEAAVIDAVLGQLAADPATPSLDCHKLGGRLRDHWSCDAGYDLRIIFQYIQFEGAEVILLVSLGTHDDLY